MRSIAGRVAIALILALGAGIGPVLAADQITVFAAASVTNAMEEVGVAWRNKTGETVRFSFASSSTLARQIEAGAPAQIFISANEKWMDYLAERGFIEKETRVSPIGNQLVMIAPASGGANRFEVDSSLDLAALLGTDGRLAVGDPAHVPAGIYAKRALRSLGLWSDAEPRLAIADNVRAALALVERGEAPLGIVYATDAAISKGVKVVGRFPAGSHPPISYPFAIVKGQDAEPVRAFFAFVTGDDGLSVFERYGFMRD